MISRTAQMKCHKIRACFGRECRFRCLPVRSASACARRARLGCERECCPARGRGTSEADRLWHHLCLVRRLPRGHDAARCAPHLHGAPHPTRSAFRGSRRQRLRKPNCEGIRWRHAQTGQYQGVSSSYYTRWQHNVLVDGLAPGTAYEYTVQFAESDSDNGAQKRTPVFSFKLLPTLLSLIHTSSPPCLSETWV